MTIITVDARECGAGKTHGTNGIISRIKYNLVNGRKTIVCLPSIILMNEYKKEIPVALCIRSDIDDNVQKSLHNAINDNMPLIIITHKAFLDSEIPYSLRNNYDLIIDEAIDPWRIETYEQEENHKVLNWKEFVDYEKLQTAPIEGEDYVLLSINNDILSNSVTRDNGLIRNLTSYNWTHYAKEELIKLMINGERTKINIISELDPLILTDWNHVHIAAAYYQKTFMSWWMRKHSIKYKIVNKFTPHKVRPKIHYPEDGNGGYAWSRNKKSSMDWLQNQFYSYVDEKIGDNKAIRLKNKIDKSGIVKYETNLPHNVAGMNEWRDYKYVILESSLNATPELEAWFRETLIHFCNYKERNKTEINEAIFGARTGYIYYQTLMRSALRDGNECEIFVIDKRALNEVMDYFEMKEEDIIEWKPTPVITSDEKKKKKPLTGAERVKVNRLRKKYPEKYKDMTPREILDM